MSKVHRGPDTDDFSDVSIQVRLEGDVAVAHTEGDNTHVLPTDTMRNVVYGLAQEHLTKDLEGFGEVLCEHFLTADGVTRAAVGVRERAWVRATATGFVGGMSEQRIATITRGSEASDRAGIEGLVLLKTTGSSFSGFPRDAFTILPEAADRVLATSVRADWTYSNLPPNTTKAWNTVKSALVESFFGEWSGSAQHQGYMMGEAALAAVPLIGEITLMLPNQHHLPFDVSRFGVASTGDVFHPVSEPYGDIRLTVVRD